MNIGQQFARIINNLKAKNQLTLSRETYLGTEYDAQKFNTTIDGYNYTVATFTEVRPDWKDCGPKGSYLNTLTVTDKDNNKVAELSATFGNIPSYLVTDKDSAFINMEKLAENVNSLEFLPRQEKTVTTSIQGIREATNPATDKKNTVTYDWK